MDQLIVMWEEVLPRKDIEMLREAKLVEVLPQSHLAEIPLQGSYPTMTLGLVFPRRRKQALTKFSNQGIQEG